MIIGGSKREVIDNIKRNVLNNELNKKVEVNDPDLSDSEIDKLLNNFYKNRSKLSYGFKRKRADSIVLKFKATVGDISFDGIEKLDDLDLSRGAIITNNHFNPLDSYASRCICDFLKKKMCVVIEDTNLALPGMLGFLMNNLNVLPISKGPNYLIKRFIPELKKVLSDGNIVLIYPEEEMWFNYRKPRYCKRGAYQFASMFNVPVISCFTEIIDLNESDNDEFNKVKYVVHVLNPIIPDLEKSSKRNSIDMADTDYMQKKEAYEKAYNKELVYDFDNSDIAGLKF